MVLTIQVVFALSLFCGWKRTFAISFAFRIHDLVLVLDITPVNKLHLRCISRLVTMLLPIEPAIAQANPKFEVLYRDLCNNKLNSDGTSVVDGKAQKERETLSQVCNVVYDEAVVFRSGVRNHVLVSTR